MWRNRLNELNATVTEAAAAFDTTDPAKTAPALAKGLTQTEKLLADVAASKLPEDAKYDIEHELNIKRRQFNDALGQALGVSLMATVVNSPFSDFNEMSPRNGAIRVKCAVSVRKRPISVSGFSPG